MDKAHLTKMLWGEVYKDIEDIDFREWVFANLLRLDEKFYLYPASSTRRHHIKNSVIDGGLFNHTILTTRINRKLEELELEMFSDFSKEDWQDVRIALAFHDAQKYGVDNKADKCTFLHPIESADFLTDGSEISEDVAVRVARIKQAIKCHNGKFCTPSEFDKENQGLVLPTPTSKFEEFVHMCDVLSAIQSFDDLFVRGNTASDKSLGYMTRLTAVPGELIALDRTSTQRDVSAIIDTAKSTPLVWMEVVIPNSELVLDGYHVNDVELYAKNLFSGILKAFYVGKDVDMKSCTANSRYLIVGWETTEPLFMGKSLHKYSVQQ